MARATEVHAYSNAPATAVAGLAPSEQVEGVQSVKDDLHVRQ